MEQALAQRLSTLTQIIVVLGVIALLGALRRYDTVELRNNVIALGALAEPANDLDPEHAPQDPKKLAALADWLKTNNAAIAKKRLDVRTRFAAWLKGALKPQQFDASRFINKGQNPEGGLPFFLEEITLPAPTSATSDDTKPPPTGTVACLIDRFEVSSQPLDIRIVSAWDETAKSSLAEETHGAIVTAVWLTRDSDGKDRIQITLAGSTNPADQAAAFTVYVGATTDQLKPKSPTLLDLAAVHADALAVLGNAGERARLRQEYGSLPVASAMSIVQDELSAAYRSVDILGFSISPTHLPVAVMLIQMVVAALVFKTVGRAPRKHEEKEVESALYPLVQDRWWRGTVWVALPVLSVWVTAVFEGAQLTSRAWPLVLLVPGSIALVLLGARSWKRAEHHFGGTTPNANDRSTLASVPNAGARTGV
jgi:hypothetical protein